MRLEQSLFGTTFQNPVLLAAGTCGFGREVQGVVDLESLGGLVTKSVTLEPRQGNPAPRVAEFGPGMINSIGLANPGAERAAGEKLPWLGANLGRARVFVSVAGHTAEEYVSVVETLEPEDGFLGFELNLSCPNDARLQGLPFALEREALSRVIREVRARTERPLLAKLAPNDPDPGATARAAEEAGADGLTLVNTLPGLVLEPETGDPVLGAGSGGVSGPALRPLGVWAVRRARRGTSLPIVGAGGISATDDALQYLRAGASLVQVGTASFADPRAAARIVAGLAAWGRRRGVDSVKALIGEGPAAGEARPGSPEPVPDPVPVAE
ncbi:MAG: dihydroorotate dehydrogenase [Gemmatimonadetes bacterium]|nr:dihydroorotate dehydrogenase [Gemmatimonadota bacterium]NIR77686.1 dihydroorotate dehydrogenase [Gemmatimonadota bacterium]NIT86232.1 dihydroorotate dehydrogenase [Gemmatimonadota bacterium]NIU30057.1 dihydroorotate dehydrogenase [Gemmatimonadota bacterium]NIU35012.1 dihydroorotate dehydrogenase [Gemmatimonadota bacterium]